MLLLVLWIHTDYDDYSYYDQKKNSYCHLIQKIIYQQQWHPSSKAHSYNHRHQPLYDLADCLFFAILVVGQTYCCPLTLYKYLRCQQKRYKSFYINVKRQVLVPVLYYTVQVEQVHIYKYEEFVFARLCGKATKWFQFVKIP